ncbi:hypothetical protein L2747_09855 [Shewanella marinintestina]|uniref:hypothetical protein n=1 Tax=Shewanella marinintestina TaxID=190305 RepID=UPI00200F9008|nr:hypothetical protein [Shewanella marinintestina]MCL1146299.1 hypothetical protein [Shewanella marinintestina]
MKKVVLCALALSLCACKSNDIRNITSSVADIASIGSSTTNSSSNSPNPGYSHNQPQYSNKSEDIYAPLTGKTSRDYGVIRSIELEKNPKGMTMVRFLAFHQDSGAALKADQYLYTVDENGWMADKHTPAYNTRTTMINSGQYYMKAKAKDGKFYTTGMLKLTPGMTNVVTIDLE